MSVLGPIWTELMFVISIGAAGMGIVGIAWTIVEALDRE